MTVPSSYPSTESAVPEEVVLSHIDNLIWDVIYADRRTQATTDRANYREENEIRIDAWQKLQDAVREGFSGGAQSESQPSFQTRVDPWLMECFGLEIARDILERNHRFLEEALELVQANGCTVSEAHQLVDYVYGRDQGEINQEVGGVMVTLAALCLASGVDMHEAAETELTRVWTKVEKIRAKHFAKPKFSPLPGPSDVIRSTATNADAQAEVVCEETTHCPDCNRIVLTTNKPATGFLAECGRRLMDINQCGGGCRAQAELVTPEMVDKALNAWFASPPSETDQGLMRSMRAALEAAVSGGAK